MTVEKVEKPVRASARGAATRSALLEAASYVFRTSGFDKAGVSEVVAQAGASVGSLYHHFTGKADLYLALYQEFQQRGPVTRRWSSGGKERTTPQAHDHRCTRLRKVY